MKLLLVLLTAVGLVLPITALNAQTSGPASQDILTANAQNGKELYLRYSCYACHGYAGHGGAGPRLVPSRMTLPGFIAYVRNPPSAAVAGIGGVPLLMPPYTAKVLSDAQLADVWAYIKTISESPPAKSIPLLNQMLNEK